MFCPWGKTLNSHSAPFYPGVYIDTGKFNAGGDPVMEQHPIQEGAEIPPLLNATEAGDKQHLKGVAFSCIVI